MTDEKYTPKVDEPCEQRLFTSYDWEEITPLYVGGTLLAYMAISGEECSGRMKNWEYRPLKTEADTKREDCIQSIDAVLTKAIDEDQPMAAELYDAGFHNGPKVGDEVSDVFFVEAHQNQAPADWKDVKAFAAKFKIYRRGDGK
jgi:hypothetical protein